jgi:Zn-dependent alcohol dehydrogenase
MCVSGHSKLCDAGAGALSGFQLADRTSRHHGRGQDRRLFFVLGAFARHSMMAEDSLVKSMPIFPWTARAGWHAA